MNIKKVALSALTASLAIGGVQIPNVVSSPAGVVTAQAAQTREPKEWVLPEGNLTVDYTDSIGSATNTKLSTFTKVNKMSKGDTQKITYTFTLNKPSYVNITAYAKIYKYNFHGSYDIVLRGEGNSDAVKIIDDKFCDGSSASSSSYVNILKAGTYKLDFIVKDTDTLATLVSNPTASIGVQAQELGTSNRSGASMADAIPTTNGGISKGAISGVKGYDGAIPFASIKEQYFRVDLPKGAKNFHSDVVLSRTGGTIDRISTVQLLNSLGAVVGEGNFDLQHMNSLPITATNLKAGTYYIRVSHPYYCEVTVNPTWAGAKTTKSSKKKSIKTLKVTAKKGTKKVKVTTVKKANVKVTIKKKTYKSKSNSKGVATVKVSKLKKGTKVKVSVSKKGYKSKSVVVKVK